MATKKKYGLIARFKDCPDLYHAEEKVRDAGFKKWDVQSLPIHGMDAAMGLKRSKVPFFHFLRLVLRDLLVQCSWFFT